MLALRRMTMHPKTMTPDTPTAKPMMIDVEAILHSKIGDRDRYVPRFLVNYLKKIVHQDEINEILLRHQNAYGLPWITGVLKDLGIDTIVHGKENLPPADDGKRYTFVSNHPLGGPDGLIYGKMLAENYGERVRILVNDLLMNLHGLAPLCVPVNKVGKQSRGLPQAIDAAFSGDYHMFVFPAGLCSRRIDGEIRDLPWQKTFIQKSVQYHRDVVPMHFNGRNSERFYRIANICKALHSPINIAMLYLADELFKNTNKTFELTIGKPIPWQTFDKTRTPSQWAQWVRNEVYNLVK